MASNRSSRKNFPAAFLATLAVAACAFLAAGARLPSAADDIGVCRPAERLPVDEVAPDPLDRVGHALAGYVTRRFLVEPETAGAMVHAAQRAARQVGLDPLLVLAVISVESRFNPFAVSGMGAKGLMQIIPRFHMAKLEELGGEDAVFDPESNILVGARILREYVRRAGGVEAGLQFYNGASDDETGRYSQKVLAERERLARVVFGARRGAQG